MVTRKETNCAPVTLKSVVSTFTVATVRSKSAASRTVSLMVRSTLTCTSIPSRLEANPNVTAEELTPLQSNAAPVEALL